MLTQPATRPNRARRSLTPAPLVIALPDGLALGGVSTWAMRLAGALAAGAAGAPPRAVTLLLHDGHGSQMEAPPAMAGVRVRRLGGLPGLRDAAGDLRPFIAAYRPLLEELHRESGGPCLFCPTALGDAYGIAAAICLTHPELVRVIGWQHSDIAYDTRVLSHYEPILSAIAGVSTHIAGSLGRAMPHRRSEIAWVPYGVEAPAASREPVSGVLGTARRPVRLIYTGRMEHEQKRVGALVALARHLGAMGIHHELVLVGDGPASAELDAAIAVLGTSRGGPAAVRRLASVSPESVAPLLARSDLFVLASRYEGLSVSMLEAMASGCVPVVTHVASGAGDAITDGLSGVLAPFGPGSDDEEVGLSLAQGVARAIGSDLDSMSREAQRTVRERYSLERHAALVGDMLDRAEASPPRSWPASRACAFTSHGGGGSGTVPADGATRMQRALDSLAGRRVVLHGAGRHTIELAAVLATSPAVIVAITDDDPGRWGGTLLGWRVVSPAEVAGLGATDVVISSWIHAGAVYARRGVYESRGIRVHQLYAQA